MSPTDFAECGFRSYFFSREESRPHIHAQHADGEAKIWIEPRIEIARNSGLNARQLGIVRRLAREHENEIREAWRSHFER